MVYILKLHIELNIADLIVKVVQAIGDGKYYASGTGGTELHSKRTQHVFPDGSKNRIGANGQPLDPFTSNSANIEVSSEGYNCKASGGGITKMVQTRVTSRRRGDEGEDGDSECSTRNLNQDGHSQSVH